MRHRQHPQDFIRQDGVPVETALRVYRRYLKLEPTHAEEYIAYLQAKVRCHAGAARALLHPPFPLPL